MNYQEEIEKLWRKVNILQSCKASCNKLKPSDPNFSIQYNNTGSFYGDSNFTRNPSTNETIILRKPDVNVTHGFDTSENLIATSAVAGTPISGTELFLMDSLTGLIGGIQISKPTPTSINSGFSIFDSIGNYSSVAQNGDTTGFFNSVLSVGDFALNRILQVNVNSNGTTSIVELETIDGVTGERVLLKMTDLQSIDIKYSSPLGGSQYDMGLEIRPTIVSLGQVSGGGGGNGTKISINDLTQLITVTNVPLYADDAAAIGGGLTTGQLYKTTTLGSTFLKIVP